MMKRSVLITLIAVLSLFSILATSGVFALWVYGGPVSPLDTNISASLGRFDHSKLYIIDISSPSTATGYTSAGMVKTADTQAKATLNLGSSGNAAVSFVVTFYNGSDVTYYYNKTETVSSTNNNIVYEVTGIQQKDAVAPEGTITATVTFTFKNGTAASNTSLEAVLNFLFVVDKDSIGVVVARTILDRFRDILNNVVAPDSYNTLDTAMNNRTGWNKASDVTFIGNVVGSNTSDTRTLENLFGDDTMKMDLDGDGTPEPVTIMIKRENLDGNNDTGMAYTYTDGRQQRTVQGAEMTIYITSQDLDSYSRGDDIVVYAAAFTKLPGADLWTDLVPLTKGTAPANNYSGGDYYGPANSFNTSKWESDNNKTLATLVTEALRNQ